MRFLNHIMNQMDVICNFKYSHVFPVSLADKFNSYQMIIVKDSIIEG